MKTDETASLPVKPIRRASIPEQIVQEIKSLIDTGHLKPGSKLPPERELAQMLGVSRPSVREALGALSLLGVVENRTGSGTFLADGETQWPSESFNILFCINQNALLEIFEARSALEGKVASLAAQRRSQEDLAAMEEALEGMKVSLDDYAAYSRYEGAFHLAVIEAAGNHVMAQLMQKLYALLRDAKERFSEMGKPIEARRERDLRNHETIYQCIKDGKADESFQAMIDHLREFENQLRAEQANGSKS